MKISYNLKMDLIDSIKRYLAHKPNITLAFLFGSAARGNFLPESDLDVAIYFKGDYTLEEIDEIWRELECTAHRNVDLVILNEARETISWAALRGIPLVIKDYKLYLDLMLEKSYQAEDFYDFIIDLWNWRKKVRLSHESVK